MLGIKPKPREMCEVDKKKKKKKSLLELHLALSFVGLNFSYKGHLPR